MLILDADQVAEITGGKVVGADGRSYAGGDVWRALIFLSEANTFFCRLQAEGAGGEETYSNDDSPVFVAILQAEVQ